jgi:hypothetical protein
MSNDPYSNPRIFAYHFGWTEKIDTNALYKMMEWYEGKGNHLMDLACVFMGGGHYTQMMKNCRDIVDPQFFNFAAVMFCGTLLLNLHNEMPLGEAWLIKKKPFENFNPFCLTHCLLDSMARRLYEDGVLCCPKMKTKFDLEPEVPEDCPYALEALMQKQ